MQEFLGGTCTCEADGGCMNSDKVPWKDPNILKGVMEGRATFARQIVTVGDRLLDSSADLKSVFRFIAKDMDDSLLQRSGRLHNALCTDRPLEQKLFSFRRDLK